MAEIKKVTKKENFTKLLDFVKGNEELTNFINHEIELLDRKSGSKGNSKTQKENVGIKEMLLAELGKCEKPTTITDLMKSSEVIAKFTMEDGRPLSNQKISALFKQMVDNDKTVVKTIDKKKTFFSVA